MLPSMKASFSQIKLTEAVCASSTCASDAMNVVLGVLWQVVVDDVGDVVHMDTSTRDS